MADCRGLPLLSGPPPSMEPADSCRKCGREFSIFLNRSRKCNHCGYSYCHSCSDYQALMPRDGYRDAGYDSMNVCAFCADFLNITAAGRGKLKAMSLAKLKKYADAYNINIDRAVEKDDVIDSILAARNPNGCLARDNESFYRKYSVPKAGTSRRGLFSRSSQSSSHPPPLPPQRPAQPLAQTFPRPDLVPGVSPHQQHHDPRGKQRQQPQPHHTPPPPPPPSHPEYFSTSSPPPAPPPPLDELMNMTSEAIGSLSITVLKAILNTNHVNAGMIIEKSDLVSKVKALASNERRERERQRAKEREEVGMVARQRALSEQSRA